MQLNEFLAYLGTGVGASALLSFVTERWPAFQTWKSSSRSYFILIGSIVIALSAWAILTYVPPEILEQLKTPFQIIAGVVTAWLGTQISHNSDPARTKSVTVIE